MLGKLLAIIVRNIFRSRTRLAITTIGCALAAFITCFFIAAEKSLSNMTEAAGNDANIIVRQKDRY